MEVYKILIFGIVLSVVTAFEIETKQSCEEFSKNVTFNHEEVLGVWHLLYRTQPGPEEIHCLDFKKFTEKEREKLKTEHTEVNGLKWERIEMRMDIPCDLVERNKTRSLYLEKIMGNGSYRTLELNVGEKAENTTSNDYHLYPMRLKMLSGDYLAMMDCNDKFVFLMSRETAKPDKSKDGMVNEHIKTYWPEDF